MWKDDGSPVTEADQRAEAIVLAALHEVAPGVAIVSEENTDSHALSPPDQFFLVDPLDGTKEFLKPAGEGAFTVNIALIACGVPVFGIVHAPALERCFAGIVGDGATENGAAIAAREPREGKLVAVASVSHRDSKTDRWLADHAVAETVSIGSSLKFCLLACGEADVYPRFSPTMEWDTAAGQAVLMAAGGSVVHPDGQPFAYGKPDYRNGAFIARGKAP